MKLWPHYTIEKRWATDFNGKLHAGTRPWNFKHPIVTSLKWNYAVDNDWSKTDILNKTWFDDKNVFLSFNKTNDKDNYDPPIFSKNSIEVGYFCPTYGVRTYGPLYYRILFKKINVFKAFWVRRGHYRIPGLGESRGKL